MELPECDKLLKAAPESQKLGEFIDWLTDNGYHLCTQQKTEGEPSEQYLPCHENIEEILALYFDIDLKKVEQEKRALLDAIRANKVP
jgi:hypothetical protein